VAGRETGADTIIELAGGVNAVQGYAGYKPLTSEAVIAAAPDVILLLDKGLESIGGSAALWELPGLALSPAGRQRRVISLDGLLLLGFGPRLGQAAMTLQQALYPTSASDERQ
jgi:iron complex transport system substrate-binding protein